MKIYFEDGELHRPNSINFTYGYLIDAKYGYTMNVSLLRTIKRLHNDATVYTNSLIALSNDFAWNEELGVSEIYLNRNGEFIRIDKLTDKELRKAHNILKMYIAGKFDGDCHNV